jgi:hypothetical protein
MADTAVSEKLLPPVFGKERKATSCFQASTPNTVLAFCFYKTAFIFFSPD